MADFIVGIVMDILRHIHIKKLKGARVSRVPPPVAGANALSWAPPSSQYCVQRSLSMISFVFGPKAQLSIVGIGDRATQLVIASPRFTARCTFWNDLFDRPLF